MPHIRAIYPENSTIEGIVTDYAKEIRGALHQQFPKYQMDAIALIPEPISSKKMRKTYNLLMLEFVIDVGKQNEPLNEEHSDALCALFIKACPMLRHINFGIWIREMPSNGFSEHKP